jgi:hypothetical protein
MRDRIAVEAEPIITQGVEQRHSTRNAQNHHRMPLLIVRRLRVMMPRYQINEDGNGNSHRARF